VTYLIIGDDEYATLEILREAPTHQGVLDTLGNMGSNKVRPDRSYGLAGWVSDVGNVMPQFRRNIVGSSLMASMGAVPNVLGGPLVITGYEWPQPGEDEWGYPEPLNDAQVVKVVGIYIAVLTAAGMTVPESLLQYREERFMDGALLARMRAGITLFRQAPQPGLTIVRHGQTRPPYGSAEREVFDRTHTPQSAAAAVIAMMYGDDSHPPVPGTAKYTVLTVRTRNAGLLDDTLDGLPGVDAAVVRDSFDPEAGTCKVRVGAGLDFLKFAMAKQGYGEVIAEEPEGS
jgi:hypothetical protein